MEQENPPINTPQLEMVQQKPSKTLLYVAIAAVLLMFTGVGYFYFQGNSTKQETKIIKQESSQTVEASPTDDAKNTTDQQLDKDVKVLDQNIDSLNSDVTDIDKNLNEQQINLE